MRVQKRSVVALSARSRVIATLALIANCAAISSALALDSDQKQIAQGLANILSSAPSCGFEVDTPALEAYYAKTGLDTPEGLAYFNHMMTVVAGSGGDKNACALAKTTAKSIGILQN